jgi:hypothetical protein
MQFPTPRCLPVPCARPIARRVLVALSVALLAGSAAAAAAEPAVRLEFREFYRQPVGPLGLEPSPRLLALAGHRVQLEGYIVETQQPVAGLLLFAPLPVQLAEADDGPADDLPGSTVFVHLPPPDAARVPAYQPGRWQVVGTLELGGREEPNGRISYVRLLAEQPPLAANPSSSP